jgi:Ca2+:H+ antiporter
MRVSYATLPFRACLTAVARLRILQASVAGVVLLHLLLIPGTAFLTGGARILEQNLHAHPTQLNHSLLTIGVLSILVPTAFFSALDRGALSAELVNDMRRGEFLSMSRAAAIILLIICGCPVP